MNADAIAATRSAGRPLTGTVSRVSLRGGRSIYVYGQRAAEVTKHSALRNSACVVAPSALHERNDNGGDKAMRVQCRLKGWTVPDLSGLDGISYCARA